MFEFKKKNLIFILLHGGKRIFSIYQTVEIDYRIDLIDQKIKSSSNALNGLYLYR